MGGVIVIEEITTFQNDNLLSLQTTSTSKGNQQKWYDKKTDSYIKAQFYYQDKYWRDDLVELIAAAIGQTLNLRDKQANVLEQRLCNIELGRKTLHGVYSKNFSRKGERFITFGRILSLNDLEFPYLASIPEKWSFVIDIIHQLCKVNYTDYMIVMTIIDYLVGNEDRHLNNFGVITDDNSYRLAPLFDFGLGLFEHDRRYEGRPFRECLKLMECKPFHKNNSKVIDFLKEKYPLEDYLMP